MIFALGTTSSVWELLQSSLAGQSGTTNQTTASSFELASPTATPDNTASACSSGNCSSPLSSQTLGALIAAQSPTAVNPPISLPSAPQNTIQQLAASLVADGNGQIGQLPGFLTGAAGHFNLAGIAGNTATGAGTDPTNGTGNATPSGGIGGSTSTNGSSTDPQGQIAGASPSTVTNPDGSTTTSFTNSDGTKITVTTPAPASANGGGSSTDPQGRSAGTSPTSVTNADGSTTTSFTWPDGTKITLTTHAPPAQPASIALPSNLASFSYNQIEQRIQSEAQSLSTFAPYSVSV